MRLRSLGVILGVLLAMLPAASFAQTSAGITGVVKDTTGAILPGVTVEASSPALIEKVRTAVTDGQGRFNITDLRPGTYTVTFSLAGFGTTKREGIELSAGFTATANADLKVGGVEETITVTGATPVVDIQNTRTQQVLKTDVLRALPSGQGGVEQFASLTLGATSTTQGRNDVGGAQGDANTGVAIHGGRGDDGKINYDGMVRIARLVSDIVRDLATSPEKPAYIEVASKQFARGGGDRPYFGSIPDFGKPGKGYVITGATKDSPAAKGGLKGGDVIVRLGASAVTGLEDFDSALRKHKGGETVPVVVMRDGAEVTLQVTLDPPK